MDLTVADDMSSLIPPLLMLPTVFVDGSVVVVPSVLLCHLPPFPPGPSLQITGASCVVLATTTAVDVDAIPSASTVDFVDSSVVDVHHSMLGFGL